MSVTIAQLLDQHDQLCIYYETLVEGFDPMELDELVPEHQQVQASIEHIIDELALRTSV